MANVCFSYFLTAILDIPIYKNTNHHNERVQALHVLFTLFSEFKNSQVGEELLAQAPRL